MYGRRVFSQLSIFQTLFCWFYIFRKKWKFKSFWSLVKTGSHSFPWTWRLSILTDGDCVFLLFALNQLTNFWRFKLKSTFQEKKITVFFFDRLRARNQTPIAYFLENSRFLKFSLISAINYWLTYPRIEPLPVADGELRLLNPVGNVR